MPTTSVRLTLRRTGSPARSVDYAVSRGDGPTVVLAPSALSPLALWRPQLRRFANRVRFLAWLPREDGSVSLDDCVAALAEEGVERFAVWGHGAGTKWAVHLAGAHDAVALAVFGGLDPRFAAIAERAATLMARPLQPGDRPPNNPWSSRSLRWATAAMTAAARQSHLLGRLAPQRDAMALAASFLRAPLPRTVRLMAASSTADALEVASQVRGPTLVMTGRADPLIDPAAVQQVARHLADSRVLVVPDAGHLLPRELPDLVGLELERWLRRAFPAEASSP